MRASPVIKDERLSRIVPHIRALALPIAMCLGTVLLSAICFFYVVGVKRFGNLYWTLQPSAVFGLSAAEKAQGLTPLYRDRKGEWGFDGQCYYRMSNDPFIRDDVKYHLDAPGYRYQRIFPSLLARLLSYLTFQRFVSPGIYYASLFLLYAGGVFALMTYLRTEGESMWYALPWALFFGTQYSLWNGTVDAASDALLILSVLAIVLRKEWFYAAAMSAACLTRETLGLVAAAFWVQGTLASLSERKKFGPAVGVRALPLAAVLSWNLYVRSRLIPLPLSQVLAAINLPFRGFLGAFVAQLNGGQIPAGLIGLYVYGALIVSAIWITYRMAKLRLRLMALFPYTVLFACVGYAVMDGYGNFLRVSSVLLAIIALCLPHLKSTMRTVAIAVLVGSAGLGFLLAYMNLRETIVVPPAVYNSSVPGAPVKPKRQSYNCDLKLAGVRVRPDATVPLGSLFTPPYLVADVEGQNLSESELRKNQDPVGKATYFTYRWVDGTGKVLLYPQPLRSSLPNDVAPGARFSGRMLVFPPDVPGNYDLRLSLLDEGEAEFDLAGKCRAVLGVHVGRHDIQLR